MKRLTIGRAPDCEWVVDDEYASPHHAAITERQDGSLWVEDLGSTNVTRLNGAAVFAPTRIYSGDVLQVGRTKVQVP